ncbi:pickpocket protein 28-like [Anticarsia gemmatalis]|uniref:pickpocket protein 28-like n=1 Tax=Anticarsia gemmatalis TaxID=129554 RepID=UPI003F75E20F
MSKKKKLDSVYYMSLLERITTLHGTNHFTSKRGRSLWLWTLLILFNVMLTISFIFVIRDKFNDNKIVTSINANCKVNQVPFPAVSICNFNLVSLRESKNIARVLRHYNVSESEIIDFFNAMPAMRFFDQGSRKLKSFTEIMSILKHHYFTMDIIIEEVHQKCENLVLYCTFNRKQRNCADIFFMVKTYSGFCCAFNYAALKDASELPFLPPDPDLEYYDDPTTDDDDDDDGDAIPPYTRIIATSESGRGSGLSIVFNVEPNDYPSWAPVPYYGVKVLVNDPNDYPETSVIYRYITIGESVDLKVEPMVFQSQSDIRRVDPDKRACWFHNEAFLGHTDRYSFETCCTECKMRNYLEACNCVPYKYPRDPTTRTCEFEDLKCLNNVTVYKSRKEMLCVPICYIECRDKRYRMTSDLTPFLPQNYPPEVTEGRNISELAAMQVYFGKSTCNCYKLTLLIDLSYFIATYGGIFSLSFGGSIITFVELLYLLVSFIITAIIRIISIVMTRNRLHVGN